MKNEKLFDGITGIREEIILKAEKHEFQKKRKRRRFIKWGMATVAAMLVIAIGVNSFSRPARIQAYAVALAAEPRIMKNPDYDRYSNPEEWREDRKLWESEVFSRTEAVAQAASDLQPFFTDGNSRFLLTKDRENTLWSPVNAYIGLAMTTELTKGETRQQILNLLGTEDLDALRRQVSAVWERVYQDNTNEICVLANSLWLEEGLRYNQDVMDAVAYHYYASVYQGDLGSDQINKDIATWINSNTGKFLKGSTQNIHLSQETVMALYSTLYFQAKWSDEFSKSKNTEGVFHTPGGDTQAIYMNKNLAEMNYYWDENFSAVSLRLKNGCFMWFILPDEGVTTNDVLNQRSYMDMVMNNGWENSKYMKVNLSVPKFDVASTTDLRKNLESMGVTNLFRIFEDNSAEFQGLTSDTPIYLTAVNQSVRVQIDEKGVKAAAYIEFPGAGSAAPAKEIIDFVLDRPFLFVITNENLPLFAGCVNHPNNS